MTCIKFTLFTTVAMLFIHISHCHKGRITRTAFVNYYKPIFPRHVDLRHNVLTACLRFPKGNMTKAIAMAGTSSGLVCKPYSIRRHFQHRWMYG